MSNNFQPDKDYSGEFVFTASRSSGPGGQNVNKVNSKIELRFNVITSALLSEYEKRLLLEKLKTKITDRGEIVIVSQKYSSQIRNKVFVIEKFYLLLNKALTPKKVRIPTRSTFAARKKRLETKRLTALKKQIRKNPEL